MTAKKHVKKPADILSPATLREYAARYGKLAEDLRNAALEAVFSQHINVNLGKNLEQAGAMLLDLVKNDSEGPWRTLRGFADLFVGAGAPRWIWSLGWIRKARPLMFKGGAGAHDFPEVKVDEKGYPVKRPDGSLARVDDDSEAARLARKRAQARDHADAGLAMVDILETEADKRDKPAKKKKRRRRKHKGVPCPGCGSENTRATHSEPRKQYRKCRKCEHTFSVPRK